ncbi:hypothetical protein [Brevundimonas denitrificans]|uniref:hypothetical protein n=1 Tax=Brevundimonas denitrificans TaxID=1443434 RepID=UPI00223ABCC5|nr:hypothetical protein [Brevundimonas denitrificans]
MADKGKGRRRGPLSDKSEVLTTRITVETRRALEDHAERAGRSISQEAELLLVRGLQGSDGSLHHLEAVLDTVLSIGRRLSQAEGGAGTKDSAFVYFGLIKALEWAQEVLPVPVGDEKFREVAELDDEIARIKREREDQAGARRLTPAPTLSAKPTSPPMTWTRWTGSWSPFSKEGKRRCPRSMPPGWELTSRPAT